MWSCFASSNADSSALSTCVLSAAGEFFALVWMEMAMCALALGCFAVFKGRNTPTLMAQRKKEGNAPDSPRSREEDLVGREMQVKLKAGDDRAVYKLWQRLKSLDSAPHGCLPGVVRAMQRLGKPASEVVAELRSAVECNAALAEGLVDLIETLRRGNKSNELVAGVEKIAKDHGIATPDAPKATTPKVATPVNKAPKVKTAEVDGPADLQQSVTIIKSFGRKRDLRGAVDTFQKLKKSGAPMSPVIYNCLLDACIQCGDMAQADAHFKQMMELDYLDVVSYNTMLKAHLRAGRVEEAEALLREMTGRGLPANSVTYNELLNARVCAKDRRGMWRLVEDMKKADMSPNTVTCSILLKALTEHSHATDMANTMELLEQMKDPMDEVLFSSVIEACIRTRRLDLLSDMMRRYAKEGGLLNLTAPTYGSMIKAYGQARDVERLWELWEEMSRRDVRPTAITLGCMVDALVKNGSVDDAWDLLHSLLKDEDRSNLVNTVIYSTILKGFSMSRQTTKVFMVYQEMRDRGVSFNTISFNTILDSCAKNGGMDRVPMLLEDMKGDKIEPDIITYSTIIKGYCLAGDIDRAFDVLKEMKRDGKLTPDEILYNSLLDGCAKQQRVEQALHLLEDMRSSGVAPSNFTLSILAKLLGRARQLNQAFVLIDELCAQHGFRPNIQVYTCLIQACIQNRQLDRALKLHDTMITESGCQPDQKLYSVLVRGCLQAGQAEKAACVVRCAHHLAGHNMATSQRSSPPGVETRMLEEVVMKLNHGGKTERQAAQALLADLKDLRSGVQDTVYAQVVRDATSSSQGRRSPQARR